MSFQLNLISLCVLAWRLSKFGSVSPRVCDTVLYFTFKLPHDVEAKFRVTLPKVKVKLYIFLFINLCISS